ncbi:TPA: hypothetical protein JLG68_001359 [Escherichia coli]|nr:hypothetical protein [Escherichia coli]
MNKTLMNKALTPFLLAVVVWQLHGVKNEIHALNHKAQAGQAAGQGDLPQSLLENIGKNILP